MNNQKIPFFDATSGLLIDHEDRDIVHRKGLWHRGVQAFIFYLSPEKGLEILVQQRSSQVDISKHKYDQSLAVQMTSEDNFDPYKSLQRGLLTELGLDLNDVKISKILTSFELLISKRYQSEPDLINNEFLDLFLVRIMDKNKVSVNCPKIKQLSWMGWNEFVQTAKNYPSDFTKTLRFYLTQENIFSEINQSLNPAFPNQTNPQCSASKTTQRVFFLSPDINQIDISFLEISETKTCMSRYDSQNGCVKITDEIKEFDINYILRNNLYLDSSLYS